MLAPSYLTESKQILATELADRLESNALSWLSGYFAGVAQGRQLNARPAVAAIATPPVVAAVAGAATAQRLTVLYGSQTGNAKRVAESLAEQAGGRGLNTRLLRADAYTTRE